MPGTELYTTRLARNNLIRIGRIHGEESKLTQDFSRLVEEYSKVIALNTLSSRQQEFMDNFIDGNKELSVSSQSIVEDLVRKCDKILSRVIGGHKLSGVLDR